MTGKPDFKDYPEMLLTIVEAMQNIGSTLDSLQENMKVANHRKEGMNPEEIKTFEGCIDSVCFGMVSVISLIGGIQLHHPKRWEDEFQRPMIQEFINSLYEIVGQASVLLWRERISYAVLSYADDQGLDKDDPSIFVSSDEIREYIEKVMEDA